MKNDAQNKDDPEASPRKPYETPAIEESGQFESLVLACGQQPDTQTFDCQNDPSS